MSRRRFAAFAVAVSLAFGVTYVAAGQAADPQSELEAAQQDIAEAMAANNQVRGELESAAAHIAEALAQLTTTTQATTTTTAATTTAPATTTTTVEPTTTTIAPTTTTAPPTSCVGVQVAAGANLVTVANAQPAGTTFCLAAGQYNVTGSGVPLQTADHWIGKLGSAGQRLTIIDGGDTATKAFTCTCSGGSIENVVIEDIANPSQASTIGPFVTDWLFDNIEFRFNTVGINLQGGSILRDSYIHHNSESGVGGQGADLTVDGNEIAFNGEGGPAGIRGGSKWVNTTNLTVTGNWVHDNFGPGLWTDGSNTGTLYEQNLVEGNDGAGIFHELGSTALITGNTARCNAGAGEIYISNSRGTAAAPIIVRGNTVGQHCNPSVASLVAKDDPNRSPRLGYVRFEDNQVTAENTLAGVFGTDPIVTPGIEFVSNDYFSDLYGTSGNGWRWGNGSISWTAWQGLGFDVTGTRQPAP